MSLSPPPPSPPPPPPNTIHGWGHFFQLLVTNEDQGQLLVIELSVLVTTIFLVLLFIHGGLRRRIHVRWWLITLMKGVYILTPIMITYIIGLMRNASMSHELFPIWALILIYIYGGVDSITACDLRDNEKSLQYALHTIPLFYWALWLGHFFLGGAQYTVPIIVLFLLATWKIKETLQALYRASQTRGLPRYIEHIVHYMRDRGAVSCDREQLDSVSMTDYRFLVDTHENGTDNAMTTQDIWGCQGELLKPTTTPTPTPTPTPTTSTRTDDNDSRSQRLKDLSLSYAWSLLLLRRFAGFTLHESSKPETLQLIQKVLLKSSSNPELVESLEVEVDPILVERVFRIIEVELSFVFDFFYTKLCIITSRRSSHKFLSFLCVPFFFWFAAVTLDNKNAPIFHIFYQPISIMYHGRSLEILLTRIVLAIIAVLEIWQICMYFLSYWKILFLVCNYVKKQQLAGPCPMIVREKVIVSIWAIKNLLLESKYIRFFLKPWKRNIGQYSFLENYAKIPIMRKPLSYTFYHFVDVPRVGQKGNTTVKLTSNVKKEIVSKLMTINSDHFDLAPGVATLENHRVPTVLPKICLNSAEVILLWHIATSACALGNCPKPAKESPEHKHYNVATQISQYCAYLLTFAPELLDDHPYNTLVFDKAVRDALRLFECLDLTQRCEKMFNDPTIGVGADARNLVEQGAVMARSLREYVARDPGKGWKVLAELWAELLLFMSLSDNATAHGVRLAQGGEFITHIWALLTHAGFVTPFNPLPAAASAAAEIV